MDVSYRFLVVLMLIVTSFQLKAQKDTLIFVGDPMCSWCYGFEPELAKIKAAFPNTDFRIIMGGLRPGGMETMMELGDFLSKHWQEIQAKTGQKFNHRILSVKSMRYDTEPACRAVVVAGKMKPEIKHEYFKAAQKSFYYYNYMPNDDATYIRIAENLGLDGETFYKNFKSDAAKEATYDEFRLAKQLGVKGFPTVILQRGDKFYLVANGYRKADELITSLRNRGVK